MITNRNGVGKDPAQLSRIGLLNQVGYLSLDLYVSRGPNVRCQVIASIRFGIILRLIANLVLAADIHSLVQIHFH